jgi:hypothetical protein
MGIWSSIKKAAKWVAKKVKAAARVVTRFVITLFSHLLFKIPDLLFGFLTWPPKHLTIHIVVLSKLTGLQRKQTEMDLQNSIAEAKRILKERFNVKLRPYAPQYVEWFQGTVPTEALNPSCCGANPFAEEFKAQGEFYAQHTAGWNGVPISLRWPVTVFIVDTVKCRNGCSLGPLSDYVVVAYDGLNAVGEPLPHSLMVHEIGHACSLPHWWVGRQNIMWGPRDRGDLAKWWQKNLLRSSRHATYF